MKTLSLLLLVLTQFTIAVNAQKLPSTQKNSIWAPTTVKIDGRLTEWGDNLQAFNSATGVNYTLANNDKNLYLAIKASSLAIINKILGAGVDFTINTQGKKSEQGAYIISFPLVDEKNKSAQSSLKSKNMTTEQLADMRKQAVKTFKEIKLTGFKDIPENVIPIYNQYDIIATPNIDDKNSFVYELAIPLKYFDGMASGTGFAYNIKINGIDSPGLKEMASTTIELTPNSPALIIAQPQELVSATDFWGTYKLAKK